jgi:hypothetical protein
VANTDGVYTRSDRGNEYWITWTDEQGRRHRRRTDAHTLQQARAARSAEVVRVEQAKVLGFAPPGQDTFAEVAKRFHDVQNLPGDSQKCLPCVTDGKVTS